MTKPAVKSFLDLIPTNEVDPNSFTTREIAEAKNMSLYTARVFARDLVRNGSAERVWKIVDGKRQPSFRVKS